jgi:hypothetical protein
MPTYIVENSAQLCLPACLPVSPLSLSLSMAIFMLLYPDILPTEELSH